MSKLSPNTENTILCAVIDDYPDWREKIETVLRAAGMSVVAKAGTRASALALLPKLTSLGVSVIILDGSLDQSSRDGDVIGRRCHELCPQILRVGLSKYLDGVSECDIVVGKDNLSDLPACIQAYFHT